ncbi:MAG: HAD-IB family hydrolase [Chloroflexi bacterium]|nr:HAD-IB family hydrolase [Chloroflexota bacterium]
MKIGAFFDVDGTLYKANMWRGLVQYASEHGRKNDARFYWMRNLPLMLLRKLSLIDEENFRKPWVSTLGMLVQGYDQAQGDAAFRWVAEQYIEPTGLNDIIACLRDHLAQGHVVILVSAMLAPTLQVLGENLDVTGTVGTEVEFVNGRYTGRVIPPVCMGVDKAKLAREFLQAQGIEIDFKASYAYADSYSDLSLFEMVGHPTAVYPDVELAAYAQEKNWQVIR